MFFREAEVMCYQGTPVDDSSAMNAKCIKLSAVGDKVFGPYEHLPGGIYSAYYALKVSSAASSSRIATLDVYLKHVNGQSEQIAKKDVAPVDFSNANTWRIFSIPEVRILEDDYDVEIRVQDFVTGLADLYVDWVMLIPTTMGGTWRDIYKGIGYSVTNHQLAVGGYLQGSFNVPKDCVVTAVCSLKVLHTDTRKLDIGFWSQSSDGYTRTETKEGKSDWSITQWYRTTLRFWTGSLNGGTTPKVWYSIWNRGASAVNIDLEIYYFLTPLFNV